MAIKSFKSHLTAGLSQSALASRLRQPVGPRGEKQSLHVGDQVHGSGLTSSLNWVCRLTPGIRQLIPAHDRRGKSYKQNSKSAALDRLAWVGKQLEAGPTGQEREAFRSSQERLVLKLPDQLTKTMDLYRTAELLQG